MTDDAQQLDAFVTPGTLLKAAREAQEIPEREAADRLNLMPDYVDIIERDDYDALRSPAFARGYVKAYGKMLGLDEEQLLAAFDQLRGAEQAGQKKRVRTRPLQLQHTGLGVFVGLAVLLLLVVALWWWQGESGAANTIRATDATKQGQAESPEPGATGDS